MKNQFIYSTYNASLLFGASVEILQTRIQKKASGLLAVFHLRPAPSVKQRRKLFSNPESAKLVTSQRRLKTEW